MIATPKCGEFVSNLSFEPKSPCLSKHSQHPHVTTCDVNSVYSSSNRHILKRFVHSSNVAGSERANAWRSVSNKMARCRNDVCHFSLTLVIVGAIRHAFVLV